MSDNPHIGPHHFRIPNGIVTVGAEPFKLIDHDGKWWLSGGGAKEMTNEEAARFFRQQLDSIECFCANGVWNASACAEQVSALQLAIKALTATPPTMADLWRPISGKVPDFGEVVLLRFVDVDGGEWCLFGCRSLVNDADGGSQWCITTKSYAGSAIAQKPTHFIEIQGPRE